MKSENKFLFNYYKHSNYVQIFRVKVLLNVITLVIYLDITSYLCAVNYK